MKAVYENGKSGRWVVGYFSLEDGDFIIKGSCDNLQDSLRMLHNLNDNYQDKSNLCNFDILSGKKYYQLDYNEKLIVADIFKRGRKLGLRLVVNLPKDSDKELIQSLNNGVWGIREMEHKDAQGIEVQIERFE